MAKKKTSAELAKEQSEIAAEVEGMLGDAFGSLGGLEQTTQEGLMSQFQSVLAKKLVLSPNQLRNLIARILS